MRFSTLLFGVFLFAEGLSWSVKNFNVSFTCDTPWIVGADSPRALTTALNDLGDDWYRILGCVPMRSTSLPQKVQPAAVAAITSVHIGSASLTPHIISMLPDPATCLAGAEAHCLAVVPDPYFGGYALLAVGDSSHLRGVLFAVYALAEDVLGVGPLDYFLGLSRSPAESIPSTCGSADMDIDATPCQPSVALPVNFRINYGVPTFTYRAIFPNDEDLLGSGYADPLERGVFNAEVWDKYLSATLRLKANTVLVGTNPYPDADTVGAVARRGLIVSNHHYNLLGTNVWRFPDRNAWSYQQHPAALADTFRASLRAQAASVGEGGEIIWSIGYRDTNDAPAPCLPPTGSKDPCSDAEKAAVINEVLGNMTLWVKDLPVTVKIMTYLWDEGVKYLEQGVLRIPDGVTVVFADAGDGNIQGLKFAKSGSGIYNHVAMYNGYANQLSEMVSVSKIFSDIAKVVSKNITDIYILNTSDMWPVPMGVLASYKAMWNVSPYNSSVAALAFLMDFATKNYGLSQSDAGAAAKIWQTYFELSYIKMGMADNYLSNAIREAATRGSKVCKPSSLASDYTTLTALLQQVNVLSDRVPASHLQAFKSHMYFQISLHYAAVGAVVALCRHTPSAPADAKAALRLLNYFTFKVSPMAEGSRWSGMLASDILTCIRGARRAVLALIDSDIQWAAQHDENRCQWYNWYDYQLQYAANYPLMFNNSDGLSKHPYLYCEPWDACQPSPDGGGKFDRPTLTVAAKAFGGTRDTFEYSLDDHPWTKYTGPITFNNSHKIGIRYTQDPSSEWTVSYVRYF